MIKRVHEEKRAKEKKEAMSNGARSCTKKNKSSTSVKKCGQVMPKS